MLNPFTNQEIEDELQYRACKTQDCPVVYFADEHDQPFGVDDVRAAVNFKLEADDRPYPLCYCFRYGKDKIADERDRTGESSVFAWITECVQAEECACRWKNPNGSCCLGDVSSAVEDAKSSS